MSQENVEIVKSLFAAFAERDFDAAAKVMHPEVEILPAIVGGPERTVYRGVDGNRQFWEDIDAAWSEFVIEVEEFRDLGEQVLVLGRATARGPGSGISLDQAGGWVADLRGGRVLQFRSFSSRQEALEAAGLSE
jgi:ketosteroid isomerase-like protein